MTSVQSQPTDLRPHWMGILAKTSPGSLSDIFRTLESRPEYQILRPPETGMIMVRGRQDTSGAPFNLGEVPVTRCTLRTESGFVGTAYVMGCDPGHAEQAALVDAMLQEPERNPDLMERVIRPLESRMARERAARTQQSEETRVEFFTLVRGE